MTKLNSNFISGITATSFGSTEVVNRDYVDNYNNAKFFTTTDGTTISFGNISSSQEFTTTGIQTFIVPSYSNILYIEAVGAGGGGSAGSGLPQVSGAGGGAGSYTSWYIPKAIVTSNITVNPGIGGIGATISGATGSAGAGTTISWTGPGGPYTLTSSAGSGTSAGAAQTSITSYFYTTIGGSGAVSASTGAGIATTRTNQYQPSGGGSGAASATFAGGSSTTNVYGISTSASGGTSSGTNGANAVAISGIPYGLGGGGGGASVSIAATGGNGVRGGGGGGGASIGSIFGNGGNGGNGYVKISWW